MKNIEIDYKRQDTGKLFEREPVDKICKEIEESKASKIILGGGRGSGKTTVLQQLENRNVSRDNQFITMRFDSIGMSMMDTDREKHLHLAKLRIELDLCRYILYYIKSYYGITYFKDFEELDKLVHEATKKLLVHIRNGIYKESSPDKLFKYEGLAPVIIGRLRRTLSPKSLSIGIDRFDWTDNRSKFSQQTISDFFLLFDRVILTTDDTDILTGKKGVSTEGYLYKPVEYDKDIDVIKSIISRRIEHYNRTAMENQNIFDENLITEAIYRRLLENADGNISRLLSTLHQVISYYQIDKRLDIEREFDLSIKEQERLAKDFQKIQVPPKFHL